MELEDIRRSILCELEDIKDVENLCYTDGAFKKLCSEKSFWVHWYHQHHLDFPNHLHYDLKDWIIEYKQILKKIDQVNDMFDTLIKGKNTTYVVKIPNHIDLLLLDEEDLEDFLKKSKWTTVKIKYDQGFNIAYYKYQDYMSFNVDKFILFKFLFNILSAGFSFRKLH